MLMTDTKPPFSSPALRSVMLFAFAIPLVLLAFNGQFARLLADDYCFAVQARLHGFPNVLIHYHNNWQATFSTTGVQALVGLMGIWGTRLLPTLLIVCLVASLTLLLREAFLILRVQSANFAAPLLAMAATLALFAGIPNPVQSLYWTSGSVTYISPCILLAIFLALLLRAIRLYAGSRAWSIVGICTGLTVIASGFTQLFVIFHIVLLSGLTVLTVRFAPSEVRKTALPILLFGLLSAVAVLIFMLLAPGTAVRAAQQPERPPLDQIIVMTIAGSLSLIGTGLALYGPLPALSLFLLSALLSYALAERPNAFLKKRWRQLLLVAAVALMLLVAACTFVIIFSTADFLPARAFTLLQFAVVLTVCIWGCIMGANLRTSSAPPKLRHSVTGIMLLVIAAAPISAMITQLSFSQQAAAFARDWDTRDNYLRTAGFDATSNVLVPRYTVDLAELAWLEPIGPDPARGMNQCAADYYGVNSIAVR